MLEPCCKISGETARILPECTAVTKSGTGTWDGDVGLGLGDVGLGDAGLGDSGDVGLGDVGRMDVGLGDAWGLGDVINKQHLNLSSIILGGLD